MNMSVSITMTFDSLDAATAFLAGRTNAAVIPADKPAPAAGKSKAEKPAPESKPAAPAAGTSDASTPAAASEPAKADKPIPTYEKSGIPEKIAALVGKDRPGAIALLAKFGAKGGELKPEQFADFTAEIDGLLSATESLT